LGDGQYLVDGMLGGPGFFGGGGTGLGHWMPSFRLKAGIFNEPSPQLDSPVDNEVGFLQRPTVSGPLTARVVVLTTRDYASAEAGGVQPGVTGVGAALAHDGGFDQAVGPIGGDEDLLVVFPTERHKDDEDGEL